LIKKKKKRRQIQRLKKKGGGEAEGRGNGERYRGGHVHQLSRKGRSFLSLGPKEKKKGKETPSTSSTTELKRKGKKGSRKKAPILPYDLKKIFWEGKRKQGPARKRTEKGGVYLQKTQQALRKQGEKEKYTSGEGEKRGSVSEEEGGDLRVKREEALSPYRLKEKKKRIRGKKAGGPPSLRKRKGKRGRKEGRGV